MISKEDLDKRICDIEGGDNTQTFREFIVESEKEFGFNNESIDMFTDEGLNKYIYFLDYLYEK